MKKLNKKVLNSSLVIMLALGLGGCAVNSATATTHKQDSPRNAKISKQSSKKTNKTDNKVASNSNSNKLAASSQSESTAVSQEGSSRESMNAKNNATVQQKNTNVTSSALTSSVSNNASQSNTQTSTAPQAHQEIQLGLGEVASWTDSQGTTHHVDSDGMDRYTTKGSQEVQYQDWSGSLPQNATVNHQN